MIRRGVSREVLRFSYDTVPGIPEVVERTEHVEWWLDDDDPPDPTASGEVILYTIDLPRLREILQAAATGEPVDDIVLALDAASLLTQVDPPGDAPTP